MSEKSNETVKRFTLEYHHTQTYAEMAPDDDGDWVRYSDYRAVLGDDMTDQLFTPKKHPSTWPAEVEELRATISSAIEHLESGRAGDARDILMGALGEKEPHSDDTAG